MRTPLEYNHRFHRSRAAPSRRGKNLDYLKKDQSSRDLCSGSPSTIRSNFPKSRAESFLNLEKFDAAEMFSGVATAVKAPRMRRASGFPLTLENFFPGYIRADRLKFWNYFEPALRIP